MEYKLKNDIERKYYKQDFNECSKLLSRIRNSLATGARLSLIGLNLRNLIDYRKQYIFITLFQEFTQNIRCGSRNSDLEVALNNIIGVLRQRESFCEFDIKNPEKTRILVEWIINSHKIDVKKIHVSKNFDDNRLEPGIDGLTVVYDNKYYNFMPTESVTQSSMTTRDVYLRLARRMGIGVEPKLSQDDKIRAIKNLQGAEYYLTKSHAFVSYKDTAIPLYRGNVLYDRFDYKTLEKIFLNGVDWNMRHMKENGQFMYYYDCTKDNNIDHEHPKRREPNLYYNDLRHCGGVIALLRAYEHTGDVKYLDAARRGLDWVVEQTQFHSAEGGFEGCYVYYNSKVKLGGVGIPLVAMMRYRMDTNDERYDRYIEGYTRHICSRLTPEGEFLGYYIHPSYNEGKPLINMTEQERRETFSFYYPGEALLGLGMMINHYNKNEGLRAYALEKSKLAMHWIINERPKYYKDMFTSLPSDSWLMQAIEEFARTKENFLEPEAIDFIFNDAQTMIEKTYKRDDSPYIDFEGGMYYEYGDHYFPDGARCEGLVAAYYLAKYLKRDDLTSEFLSACKKAAWCQFQLSIDDITNYAHKNPEKSRGCIKFKVTRQWARTDSIQHVACFFARLYRAENDIKIPRY